MARVYFKEFEIEDDEGNITLSHYDDIGSQGPQLAASYEIAADPDFNYIIDSTYFNQDPRFFKEWYSALPCITIEKQEEIHKKLLEQGLSKQEILEKQPDIHFAKEAGEYYDTLKTIYARGRIFAGILPTNFVVPDHITDEDSIKMCRASDGMIHFTEWSEVGTGTQLYQEITITQNGEVMEETNSDKLQLKNF